MNKIEKVNFILAKLDELFPNPRTELHYINDFTCLVAVMLSAQCSDRVVNAVTNELFKVATTPQKILSLGEDRLRTIIHPCGLFNVKASAILKTAKKLLNDFGGAVPCGLASLEALPGVGHKTAAVIMSQLFSQPAFPVDTHISRLANRWGLTNSQNVRKIENDLKDIFPKQTWKKIHIQLILYGRKFCPARRHIIPQCPICSAISDERLDII